MDNIGTIIAIVLCSIVLGIVLGITTETEVWSNDCKKVGAHLTHDHVFVCSVKEPTNGK